jgi:5-formyltetrahydrofolate cyclo-ligase
MTRTVLMTKDELRLQIKGLLATFKQELLVKKSMRILASLLALDCYKQAELVLSYVSTAKEVSTDKLIETARKYGKLVYAPRITGQELLFHLFPEKKTALFLNSYGIGEPSPVQPRLSWDLCRARKVLIIVPALAFDRGKNRLGRGKGYYDRFLGEIKKQALGTCTRVGLCFSDQLVEALPAGKNDIPVDLVITDQEIIR